MHMPRSPNWWTQCSEYKKGKFGFVHKHRIWRINKCNVLNWRRVNLGWLKNTNTTFAGLMQCPEQRKDKFGWVMHPFVQTPHRLGFSIQYPGLTHVHMYSNTSSAGFINAISWIASRLSFVWVLCTSTKQVIQGSHMVSGTRCPA